MSLYYLKTNIKSSVGNKIYALKGEMVTKISDHDNVMIVSSESGERFGVNISNLSKEFIEKEKTIVEVKINKNATKNIRRKS